MKGEKKKEKRKANRPPVRGFQTARQDRKTRTLVEVLPSYVKRRQGGGGGRESVRKCIPRARGYSNEK